MHPAACLGRQNKPQLLIFRTLADPSIYIATPTGRLTDLTCLTKQLSYKIIITSTYIISSSKVPISLLNLSRYSSLANICLSKAFLHLGAWSYQSKDSIFGGYNWIFITKKYNNINGGISTIQVYWPSSGQLLSRTHYLSI